MIRIGDDILYDDILNALDSLADFGQVVELITPVYKVSSVDTVPPVLKYSLRGIEVKYKNDLE